jgi:uncharacterized protein YdaL
MAYSSTPVSTNELSRLVVYNMQEKQAESPTPNQVTSIYKCLGKFISFMFKKAHYEWVAADISSFGSVIRNTSTNNSQFVPASCLTAEIGQTKASASHSGKELQRQDLALSKIA